MPGLDCRCGLRIGYGEIPCSDEYLLISDVEFEPFWEEMDVERLYNSMRGVLKCPRCGRLWVFWDGYQNVAQEFMPVGDGQPAPKVGTTD
jgi:hypothetical protein